MGRKAYLALVVSLLALLGFLCWGHLNFAGGKPEAALKATPKEASWKLPPQELGGRAERLPELDAIWERGIFFPANGAGLRAFPEFASAKGSDLELIGVCRFGDEAGAVIGTKGASGKTARKFYAVGAPLGNGFALKEVRQDGVVLGRGSEELSLKLHFGSESGNARRQAELAANAPPPQVPPPAAASAGEGRAEAALSGAAKERPDERAKELLRPPPVPTRS